MTKQDCSLIPNCGLTAENKKDKHYTRLIECRMCLKSWHAFCVGYHTLKEDEFNEQSKTFVCNKCNYFVHAVSDIVAEKVRIQMQDLFAQLESKTAETYDKLSTALLGRKRNSIEEKEARIVTQPNEIKNGSTNNDVANISNTESPKINVANNSTTEILETNEDTDFVSNKLPSNKQDTISSKTEDNLYVCSIEKELTLNDVRLILEDAEVHVKNIELWEITGDFKRKRFIEVTSKEKIDLFKFKHSFSRSKLCGTWFLRSTPPRSPVEVKQSSKQQSYQAPVRHQPRQMYKSPTFVPTNRHATNDVYPREKRTAHYNSTERDHTTKPTYADTVKDANKYPSNSNNNYIRQSDFQYFLEGVIKNLLIK